MKKGLFTKFVLLIFFSLFSFNNLYAKSAWETPLTIRSASDNILYNIIINDYNKFKKEFIEEVLGYCVDQGVKGGGYVQLLTMEKCNYGAAVDLATKHGLNYGKFSDRLFDWHQDSFPVVKNHARALIKCNSKSCTKSTFDSLHKANKSLLTRLFKNLDRVIVQYADQKNKEFYSKKKKEEKKEESEPKIDDNKIVAAASGTGFFVSNTGHIITNNHVTEGCDVVKVSFKGDQIEAKVLASDKVNDLAIAKSDIKPTKVYSVSTEDVTLLEDVIIAGYPLGKSVSAAIKTSKGSVTALAGYNDNYSEFQTDAALNQGNSGGPIMNQSGNVVGVAVANFGKKAGVESFNFGIKSSTLRAFANSNGLIFLRPNNKEMANKELGQLITEATVYLECWMTVAKIKQLIAQENNQKAFFSKYH